MDILTSFIRKVSILLGIHIYWVCLLWMFDSYLFEYHRRLINQRYLAKKLTTFRLKTCLRISRYCDGTFKVVPKPFTQLYTVNAFIRQGSAKKQVPLLYCLMSSRRYLDYTQVMKQLHMKLKFCLVSWKFLHM